MTAVLSQRKRPVSKRGGPSFGGTHICEAWLPVQFKTGKSAKRKRDVGSRPAPLLSAGDVWEKATSMAPQTGLEMLAPPLECRRSGSADRRHWLGCQLLMRGPPFSHAVAHDAAQRAPASASRRTSASGREESHRAPAGAEACRWVVGAAARLRPSPSSERTRSIRLPPQPSTRLVS